jgi:hypothetical protein
VVHRLPTNEGARRVARSSLGAGLAVAMLLALAGCVSGTVDDPDTLSGERCIHVDALDVYDALAQERARQRSPP